MHEYSVVQSLLESCEEHARVNEASKVTKVVVKIGVLSGVEPDLLQTAFDTFKEQTVCHDAEFLINHQKILHIQEKIYFLKLCLHHYLLK